LKDESKDDSAKEDLSKSMESIWDVDIAGGTRARTKKKRKRKRKRGN